MEHSGIPASNNGDKNVGNWNSFLSTVDNSEISSEHDKFSLVPVTSTETYSVRGPDISAKTNTSTLPCFGITSALAAGTSTSNLTQTEPAIMESFKRPAKSNAPVNFPSVTPRPDRPGRITNQLKFLQTALCQSLWRRLVAAQFQRPVDPIAWGCPDYYETIKNPMDLGTIKQRLQNQYYWTAQECLDDFNLMFRNCHSYNNPGDPVVKDCVALKKFVEEKVKEMPSMEVEVGSGSKNLPLKKNVGRMNSDSKGKTAFHGSSSESGSLTPLPGNKCVKRKADTTTPAQLNPGHPFGVSGSIGRKGGQIARNREMVKRVQDAGRRTRPRLNEELLRCKDILKELVSRKHRAFAHFFYEPVDPVKHEAPGYFDIIKNPMDLGTVQKRLDGGLYNTRDEFAADVRLIFTNCLTYNKQDVLYRQAAQKMQDLFEQRFAVMVDESGESETFELEEVLKTEKESSSSESEDDVDEDIKNQILLLQTKMAAASQQLAELHAKEAKKQLRKFKQRRMKRQAKEQSPPRKQPNLGNARSKTKSRSRIPKQGSQRNSAGANETIVLPMNAEELQSLHALLCQLPVAAHNEIFRIMQSMEPVRATRTECTVDFENMQPRTLRALQAYATDYFERRAQAYASDLSMVAESAVEGTVRHSGNSQEGSDSSSSGSSSSSDSSSDSSEEEDADGKDEHETLKNSANLPEPSAGGYNEQQQSFYPNRTQQQPVFFHNVRKLSTLTDTQKLETLHNRDIQKQQFRIDNIQELSVLQEETQNPSLHVHDVRKPSLDNHVQPRQLSDSDNEPLNRYPPYSKELPNHQPFVEQQQKSVPMIQPHMLTPLIHRDQHQAFLARSPQNQITQPHSTSRYDSDSALEFSSVITKPLQLAPVGDLPLDTIKAKQQYQKQQEEKRKRDQEIEKQRLQAENAKSLQEQQHRHRIAEELRKRQQHIVMPRSQMIPGAPGMSYASKPRTPLRNERVANPNIAQVVTADETTSGKVDAERQKMREDEQRRRQQSANQIDLNFRAELLRKFESGELY